MTMCLKYDKRYQNVSKLEKKTETTFEGKCFFLNIDFNTRKQEVSDRKAFLI